MHPQADNCIQEVIVLEVMACSCLKNGKVYCTVSWRSILPCSFSATKIVQVLMANGRGGTVKSIKDEKDNTLYLGLERPPSSEPMLTHFEPSRPCVLEPDASKYCMPWAAFAASLTKMEYSTPLPSYRVPCHHWSAIITSTIPNFWLLSKV